VAWALVAAVTARAADEAYTVKRGDTIYGIARSYGIPPTVLAERNGLSRSFHVYAGQHSPADSLTSRGVGAEYRAYHPAPLHPARH
jgi:hypothetical protein